MSDQNGQTGTLMAAMLGLCLLGGVLVAYLWETLNRLLSLHFEPVRLIGAIPILLAFLLLLRFTARRVGSWGEAHDRSTSRSEPT